MGYIYLYGLQVEYSLIKPRFPGNIGEFYNVRPSFDVDPIARKYLLLPSHYICDS